MYRKHLFSTIFLILIIVLSGCASFKQKALPLPTETMAPTTIPPIPTPDPSKVNYPESWVISEPIDLVDKVVSVNGDLTITSGGSLRLTNSTLIMQGINDKIPGIKVLTGGSLFIEGSLVTSHTPYSGYEFIYQKGSIGKIERSTLEYISGNDLKFGPPNIRDHAVMGGLTISSDGFILRDSIVRNGLGQARGILVGEARNVTIEGNVITGHQRDGIRLAASEDVMVRHNTISGNSAGIKVMGCTRATIVENIISGNHVSEAFPEVDGIAIMYGSTDSVIEGNQIFDNQTSGIVMTEVSKISVVGNIITGNLGYGIHGYGNCSDILISKNILSNNLHEGILLQAQPDTKNNVIIDNSIKYPDLNGVIDDYEETVKEGYSSQVLAEGTDVVFSFEKEKSFDGSSALQVNYSYPGKGCTLAIHKYISQDWSDFSHLELWVKADQDVTISVQFDENRDESKSNAWSYFWKPVKAGEWINLNAPFSGFKWRADISRGDGVLQLTGIGMYSIQVCPVMASTEPHTILFDNVQLTN